MLNVQDEKSARMLFALSLMMSPIWVDWKKMHAIAYIEQPGAQAKCDHPLHDYTNRHDSCEDPLRQPFCMCQLGGPWNYATVQESAYTRFRHVFLEVMEYDSISRKRCMRADSW